jgi:AcrR family transcriptional regulator
MARAIKPPGRPPSIRSTLTGATRAAGESSDSTLSRRSLVAPAVSVAPVVPLRERFRREVATAIAVAAEEVFAEEGVHSAHVGHIAKRAGVAVGTLYNYYEDRDALLAALLRQRGEELATAFTSAITSAEREPVPVQLRAFVDAYFAFFVAHRPYFKILFEGEITQLYASYPRSAAIPAQYHQAIFALLDGVFRRAADAGQLRPDKTGAYPWLLLGMLRAVAVGDLRGGRGHTRSDGAEIVNVFLRGVSA